MGILAPEASKDAKIKPGSKSSKRFKKCSNGHWERTFYLFSDLVIRDFGSIDINILRP